MSINQHTDLAFKNGSQQINDIAQIYGIDFFETYSGEEVALMLLIIDEEAFKKIEESYKDGYKEGYKEYAPKVSLLKNENNALQQEINKLKKENKFKVSFLAIPIWTIVGLLTGSLATIFTIWIL